MTMPVVRLEINHMRHTILAALTNHAIELDSYIQAALEEVCDERNVAAIVKNEAESQIKIALQEEVRNFFKYGSGRKALKAAVCEYLEKEYPEE